MKIEYLPEAELQVLDVGLYWILNRDKNPGLFESEMEEAERFLLRTPHILEVYTIRNGVEIRRYLLKTGHHVYYQIDEAAETVLILSVYGGPRKNEPDLNPRPVARPVDLDDPDE